MTIRTMTLTESFIEGDGDVDTRGKREPQLHQAGYMGHFLDC